MQFELPARTKIEYKYVILEEQVKLLPSDFWTALRPLHIMSLEQK